MIEQRTCQCPPIATATLAPNQDRRGDLVRFFTGRYTLSLDIIPNNHSSATVGAHLQGLRPVCAHWPARRASSSQDPMENATTPAATARTSRPWKRSNPAHVPVPATGPHRSHDTAPVGAAIVLPPSDQDVQSLSSISPVAVPSVRRARTGLESSRVMYSVFSWSESSITSTHTVFDRSPSWNTRVPETAR